MSLATLQELMGHKKKETTLKYIHLAKTIWIFRAFGARGLDRLTSTIP